MKTNQPLILVLFIATVLIIGSCAQPEVIDPCVDITDQKGFIWGLIHGFIAPLSFIISLFMDSVTMYGVNNSGGWYDFGFLLGIGGFSGGIFKSSKKKRNR